MSISRNSIITFASHIIIFIFSAISSVIITRTLGPTGKGVYASIFIIIFTALDLLRLNIDMSSVYHLSSTKYKIGDFLLIYLMLTIILSGLAIGIYFIFTSQIHNHILKNINNLYMNIAIFSIPIFFLQI